MIRYHFDLYPRDDPRDGTRVVRFTKLQQAEYRGEANGTGAGRLSIRADVAEAQLIDPRGLQYVRVVREDTVAVTELVVGGFWLETGDFSLLDSQGTRLLSFGGAGTLAYLSRAVMASHTYISPIFTGQDPFDDVWRLYAQSTFYANGNYLGAMLWRVLYEATHNVPGTHRHANGIDVSHTHADDRPAIAIPDLVMDFDAFVDTEGNDWTLSSGEFKAQVGENVLAVVKRLMEAGLYVQMDPDTFELRAWQGRPASRLSRSTDRTGGAWATGVVRFQAPVGEDIDTGNIKSDAKRAIAAFIKRSWLLAGGNDVYGDATGGSDVPWEGFYYADVNDVDAAANVAAVQITARDDAGDTLRLRGKLGNSQSTGHYKPFEHALLDDLVTVHTGSDQFDHDEQDFPIAAITINLRPGGDWDVWYDLGSSYSANPSRQFQVAPVPAHNHPPNLCIPMSVTEPTVLFRYTSLTDAMTADVTPDAAWDVTSDAAAAEYALTTAPASTRDGAISTVSRNDVLMGAFAFQLDSSSAALIAAGGATILAQFRARMRAGVGVDDGAQDGLSQMGVRVTQGDSTTIRGTALALHNLGTLAGSTAWQRSSTYRNQPFPAEAATNVLTAVPGTVPGDFLLIEVGVRNLTPNPPAATGAHLWVNDMASAVGDLPANAETTWNGRSWVQITGAGSSGTGDGHADLIGTSNRASRCDHRHDVHRDRAPTVSDDGSIGYKLGTIWAQLDDLETPTEVVGVWMLVDASEGAAVWLAISSTSSGSSLTIEEEDTSPSGVFSILKVPNGSLTDNGDGSASLGFTSLVVDHGTMGASEEFDASAGHDHEGTQDDDLTVTLIGATSGEAGWMTLVLAQDGTGGHSIDLPSAVVNDTDLEAAWDQTASAVNILTLFSYDGGTTWYGALMGGSGGAAGALDDLTDVTITSPEEDQQLQFIGSEWVNNHRRWEPVTTNPGGGPEIVFDGSDDIVMTWVDYS
jgi:hypothetical protein